MVKSGPNAGKLRGLDKNCVKLLMQCGSKLSRAMFLEAIDVTMCPNVSGFPQGEALSTRPNQPKTIGNSKRIRQLITLYTFDLYKPFLLHCLYLVRQHNQQHRTNLMRNASMTNYKFG